MRHACSCVVFLRIGAPETQVRRSHLRSSANWIVIVLLIVFAAANLAWFRPPADDADIRYANIEGKKSLDSGWCESHASWCQATREHRPGLMHGRGRASPLDRFACPVLGWGCRFLKIDHRTLLVQQWKTTAVADLRSKSGDAAAALSSLEGLFLQSRNLRFAFLEQSSLYRRQPVVCKAAERRLVAGRLSWRELLPRIS